MGEPDEQTAPTLAAYAAAHGMTHREHSFVLPQATQLLRHGFMREVPSLARGPLPGGSDDAYLAQVDYVYEGRNDLKRSYFTLVLVEAPASLGFAVRVLCHDRDLDELDMSNPDRDREIVEADDRGVTLESEAFRRRYALFTDRDQDELSVWRLFAPTLIEWLATDAPADFSFELQDGALCCFVPGTLSEAADLDALCSATARVLTEVARVGGDGGRVASAAVDGRRTEVDEQLAAHPFDHPPASVKSAAKAFRRGPRIGDRAWKLGAEAFFRTHAEALGFAPIEQSAFRSSHMQTFLPGELAHVAADPDGATFLVLTDKDDYDDMGWSVIVADGRPPIFGRPDVASGVSSERGRLEASFDARSVIFSALDGGRRDRRGEELGAFVASCRSLLGPA